MSGGNPYAEPDSPFPRHKRDVAAQRTIAAWGCRYMAVGAFIGLILPLFVLPSTIPPIFIMPVCGALVGTVIGGVAGAIEHAMRPKAKEKAITDEL